MTLDMSATHEKLETINSNVLAIAKTRKLMRTG